jgi:2,3-bisphosphoglycerate-independent phosphoglycerate mutase
LSGEERILVDSPKVATYDLQPEMSANIVTDKLIHAIDTEKFDFIAVNYANADMVGHTGNYTAAVQAVQALDACLSILVPKALEHRYDILITADHGNSEQMVNYDTGEPFTQHTTGPVPLFYISNQKKQLKSGGSLQDIAPSILAILGLSKPAEMTGSSLIKDEK